MIAPPRTTTSSGPQVDAAALGDRQALGLPARLWRGLPLQARRALKQCWMFVFFGTFEAALRMVPVGTERYFWAREAIIHMPGSIGLAYRGRFYRHYFKKGSDVPLIQVGVCIEHPQGVEVGDRVSMNRCVWLNAVGGLKIGSGVGFGPGVVVHTANHNFSRRDVPWADQGWTLKSVEIGDDAWLAASVTVLPGTCIGTGAIVAAGATVSGNVEPFAVVAGNPARKIGSRQHDGATSGSGK